MKPEASQRRHKRGRHRQKSLVWDWKRIQQELNTVRLYLSAQAGQWVLEPRQARVAMGMGSNSSRARGEVVPSKTEAGIELAQQHRYPHYLKFALPSNLCPGSVILYPSRYIGKI